MLKITPFCLYTSPQTLSEILNNCRMLFFRQQLNLFSEIFLALQLISDLQCRLGSPRLTKLKNSLSLSQGNLKATNSCPQCFENFLYKIISSTLLHKRAPSLVEASIVDFIMPLGPWLNYLLQNSVSVNFGINFHPFF